jgi:hypothetical protein
MGGLGLKVVHLCIRLRGQEVEGLRIVSPALTKMTVTVYSWKTIEILQTCLKNK